MKDFLEEFRNALCCVCAGPARKKIWIEPDFGEPFVRWYCWEHDPDRRDNDPQAIVCELAKALGVRP